MRRLITVAVAILLAGCSSKPCADGSHTSGTVFYRSTKYDACNPKDCCGVQEETFCSCTKRCPCWQHATHLKGE